MIHEARAFLATAQTRRYDRLMGQISSPIMTPLGVAYRSYHDTAANALKYSEWGVKVLGGEASGTTIFGPGRKGFYEAGILVAVPVDKVTCVNPDPKKDLSWQTTPSQAYVLFDELEVPLFIYFPLKRYLVKVPHTANYYLPMDQ
jgi:hypothetical protein